MLRTNRNTRILLLYISMIFLLSSCISPSDFSSNTEQNQTESAVFPDYIYDSDFAQNCTKYRASVAETGYYFVTKMINNDSADSIERNLLYYYDINTGTPIILCDKGNCRHEDINCKAYVYQHWLDNPKPGVWAINCDFLKTYAYKGQLYMLVKKDNVECYLNRYDQNYANEERVACLSEAERTPRVLVVEESASLIYDSSFYYLTFEIDDKTAFQQGCDTTFTFCRVKLEKGAIPEKLYSFTFPADYNGFWTMGGGSAFRIVQSGGDVYCIAAIQYRDAPEKNQVEQRVIRYNEADGAALLWEYSGNEKVNLMGAEGEGPAFAAESFMDNTRTLYYTCEERQPHTGGKAIRSINLETGESKEIYRNPDSVLSELSTDGEYFYFFECLKDRPWRIDLTGIDHEGNVIRRYEFEYVEGKEEAVRKAEESGTDPDLQSLNRSDLKLLIADSRYLMIGAYDYNDYKDFQLQQGADAKWLNAGIGLIETTDFLSGKNLEVRKLRMQE